MTDSNSFVFGALSASSASFSCGTFDVKAKRRPRNRIMVAKGGRNRISFGANTESSATNSNLSNSTLTTPFSNPFPSSHPPYITGTSGAGETTNFPAPISSGLQSSNAMNSMVFLHAFSSSFVTHGKTLLSLSTNAKPITVAGDHLVRGSNLCFFLVYVCISFRTSKLICLIIFHHLLKKFDLDKKVMPLSSDHGENSSKDAQPNQQTIQKEIETVPKMEETYESVSSPRLPLIPISRILKGIPHSPHFLQLRSYSELARKSLMAGWDRAFEETVEEIHTLTANDFWVRSSKLWKTMEELQSLGYNVFRPRKRLVELTEVMEELKQYKMWIRRLKSKAESHRMEKCRLECVILGLQKRAEREKADFVETLEEVTKMQIDPPKFAGAFAALAIEPM